MDRKAVRMEGRHGVERWGSKGMDLPSVLGTAVAVAVVRRRVSERIAVVKRILVEDIDVKKD